MKAGMLLEGAFRQRNPVPQKCRKQLQLQRNETMPVGNSAVNALRGKGSVLAADPLLRCLVRLAVKTKKQG